MRLIANQGLVRPCTAVRTTSAAVAVRASIAPAIRCRYSLRTMSKTSSVGIAAPKLPVTRALRVGPKRGTAKGPVASMVAIVAGAVVGGIVVGMLGAFVLVRAIRRQLDPLIIVRENAALREKVDALSQVIVKLKPMSSGDLKLRFSRGISKTVILGMVDQMLANKDVNIKWLPDDVERILYVNVITLMLQVLDEVVTSMSINFAGHNVKLQLTHLDADTESPAGGIPVGTLAQAAANLTLKQQALLKDVVGNGGGATAAPA